MPGFPWAESLDGLERQWRIPLGKGFPGPTVGRDRVFVVGSEANGGVSVRALRRSDGEELWRRDWRSPASVPFFARSHGAWVRSTPAYDGETLYVGDMLEVLVALDGETGAERWRIDFPTEFSVDRPPFGFASSPLVTHRHLYVQAANALIKVEERTGRIVWRSADSGNTMASGGAFSSPIIAELHGVEQVVVFTRPGAGHRSHGAAGVRHQPTLGGDGGVPDGRGGRRRRRRLQLRLVQRGHGLGGSQVLKTGQSWAMSP